MKTSNRNLKFRLQPVLVILFFAISIPACGVGPHSDAPEIKILNSEIDKTGMNIISSNPTIETRIELSKPEDRTVFIEILTNEEYVEGKKQKLVSGDEWGGKRFKGRSNSNGIANFQINESDYNFRIGQKYWVRSGVLIGQRDFGILVSLIEMPIDKRSGHLFETIRPQGKAIRVVFGVGDFLPFSVAN